MSYQPVTTIDALPTDGTAASVDIVPAFSRAGNKPVGRPLSQLLALTPPSLFASTVVNAPGMMPTGHVFGTGVTKPLSTYFQTLAAAQALYPFATALTQETDGCAIQLTLNALAAQGGGTALMPISRPKLNFTLLVKGNLVALQGAGPARTTIDASGCALAVNAQGGSAPVPGIHVTGDDNSTGAYTSDGFDTVLRGFALIGANTGTTQNGLTPPSTVGLPATGFVPGSVGIFTELLTGFKFRELAIGFWDNPTQWGQHCWSSTMEDVQPFSSNNGASIPQMPTRYDSGENMRWIGGNAFDCNNNIKIDCSTADGNLLGGSVAFDGMSFDYPWCHWIVYIGSTQGQSYSQMKVNFVGGMHFETTGSKSGQEPPIYAENGTLVLIGATFQWSDGQSPRGLVTSIYDRFADNAITRVRLIGCSLLGMDVPLGVSPDFTTDGQGVHHSLTCARLGRTDLTKYPNLSATNQFVITAAYCDLQNMGRVRVSQFGGTIPVYQPTDDPFADTLQFPNGAQVQPYWACGKDVMIIGGGSIDLSTISSMVNRGGVGLSFRSADGAAISFTATGPTLSAPTGFLPQMMQVPGARVFVQLEYNVLYLRGDLVPTPVATTSGAFPMAFTGAAGAPTGLQAVTGALSAPIVLDGAGNLKVPPDAEGQFTAAGIVPDGRVVEFDLAAANTNAGPGVFVRVQPDGSAVLLYFVPSQGQINIALRNASGGYGSFANAPFSGTLNSFGFSCAGGTLHALVNGVAFHDFAIPNNAPGYMTLANPNHGGPNTLISGIKLIDPTVAAPRTTATGLTAAGTNQGTALALSADNSVLTTVAAGTGVQLRTVDGQRVLNRGANPLLVYPPTGGRIETGAANASFSVAAGGSAVFSTSDNSTFFASAA